MQIEDEHTVMRPLLDPDAEIHRTIPDSSDLDEDSQEDTPISVKGTAMGHLRKILRIALPRFFCKATVKFISIFLLITIVAMMGMYNAKLSNGFVSSLQEKNGIGFVVSGIEALILSTLFTMFYTISIFLNQSFSIDWRSKVVGLTHSKYFNYRAYYRLQHGKESLDNPDQRLTADTTSVTTDFCSILFGTPVRDGVYYQIVSVLSSAILIFREASWVALAVAFTWFLFGFILNKILIKPIIALSYRQNNMEGDFRFVHVRARTFAESIAFYKGEPREKKIVDDSMNEVVGNFTQLINRRIPLNFSNYFISNFGACVSFVIPGITVFVLHKDLAVGQVIELAQYINMLLRGLSEILNYGQDFSTLLGASSRVGEIIDRLDEFEKRGLEEDREILKNSTGLHIAKEMVPVASEATIQKKRQRRAAKATRYQNGNEVVMENIQLHTPDGDRLIDDINIHVGDGEHLVIVGPSGTGKSSILRVMAGLWRNCGGTVIRPDKIGPGGLFFVPQRPYIVVGSLRDQLCYPFEASKHVHTNTHLMHVLELVGLEDLPQRIGDLDSVTQWEDVLSLGEQQRLGFARMFFHMPRYAILDEATASLDFPLEKKIYQTAKSMGITLISVAHRTSAFPFHDWVLKLSKKSHSATLMRWEDVPNIDSLYAE
ncbi:hypothetical protein PCE1_000950 [Barthelona sp. PCE]